MESNKLHINGWTKSEELQANLYDSLTCKTCTSSALTADVNKEIDAATNYFLSRSGSVNTTSNCWTSGPILMHYRVFIAVDQLDEYGFVVDNKVVEKYFSEMFEGKSAPMSCEMIAHKALRDFLSKLPSAKSIRVAVTGNPDATWLTAAWHRV